MISDRDKLLRNVSSGGAGPLDVAESHGATQGEATDFEDCGILKKLFRKSADIRNKTKESVPEEGLQIANYDENTVVNQGTSEWPLPQLTFHHVHGSNIQILQGGRVAKRRESFCKGLAFSSRPIQIDENVCIRFAEVVSNWSGVLRFGVTNVDPETFRDMELPKFACPDLTSKEGYWAKALPERYSIAGSILHFYVNAEGELYYGINGVLKGQFLNGINVFSPLWVIVDIYGNSSSLEFIDPNEVRFRSTRSGVNKNRANSRPLSTTSLSQTQTATTSATAHYRRLRSSSSSRPNLPISKYHAGVQFTPLTFHSVRGKHVALSHGYTVAERHAGEYACGYVFTSRPLALNEKIVIQVLDVEPAYTGSMAFGLTCCNPIDLQGSTLPVDSDDLLERPEYWVGIKDVAAKPKITDELSFWIAEKGEVYFAKNNLTPRVIIHVDTSVKLWAYFDIYGTTQIIRLLGSVKVTAASQIAQRMLPYPASSKTSRSLLDLSPDIQADAIGSSCELSPWQATGIHPVQADREDSSPFSNRRTQSETGDNLNGIFMRLPSSAQSGGRIPATAPITSRPSRPLYTMSGEHFINLVGNFDNIHGRYSSESNISHRPHFPPPPVPTRINLVSERSLFNPPSLSSPPVVANHQKQQQRNGDDQTEMGDECGICMNAKVNCVIYTCGHMSMCFECATETWHIKGECPICRKKIEDVIKIFKS